MIGPKILHVTLVIISFSTSMKLPTRVYRWGNIPVQTQTELDGVPSGMLKYNHILWLCVLCKILSHGNQIIKSQEPKPLENNNNNNNNVVYSVSNSRFNAFYNGKNIIPTRPVKKKIKH